MIVPEVGDRRDIVPRLCRKSALRNDRQHQAVRVLLVVMDGLAGLQHLGTYPGPVPRVQAPGKGYRTRINRVLERCVRARNEPG